MILAAGCMQLATGISLPGGKKLNETNLFFSIQ